MEKLMLNGSENLYSFLLELYPARYKREFAEEMKYVFSESLRDAYEENKVQGVLTLWARTIVDGLQSGPREHLENIVYVFEKKKGSHAEEGGETMSTKSNDLISDNKVFVWGALATAAILMIPVLGNWPWTLFDFIFASTLLFGMGSAFVLIARKAKSNSYRLGVGLGLLTAFLLMWINAAVGIIGDPEDYTSNMPNLIYMGVYAIGFFGAIISRFKPEGMAKTLFAAAIVQFLVPVVMLIANPHVLSDAPGVLGVFTLNSFFAFGFAGSGLLFKQASDEKKGR